MLRRLLTPGWLALHAAAAVVVVGLVGLGRWQWHRALETHRFQNYSYAFEWWLFAAFAVFLWVKTMADSLEDAPEEPEGEPVPVAPLALVDDDDDPELAAYNRRLAELHARDQADRATG
jgi:DNA-binding transcriptional regulator of glucitol operon